MVDIETLEKAYFYFDLPVHYQLRNKEYIDIMPINVKDSELFLSSIPVLTIDKNSLPSVEIIQMSYLEYLFRVVFAEHEDPEQNKQAKFYKSAMVNILLLTLGLLKPVIKLDEKQKPYIYDLILGVHITPKDFDDIKRIILYQNLYKYDDTYIDPDARKAMADVDELKNQDYAPLSIERKMAIITAHTGVSKKEQMEMTLRSHSILFDEVVGEVEFTTTRAAILIGGGAKDSDHWIYKKKKNKFQGYFVSDKDYNKKMGGDGNIVQSNGSRISQQYNQQFNSFNQ